MTGMPGPSRARLTAGLSVRFGRARWRSFPAYRDIGLTRTALAASEGAVQACATQALQLLRLKLSRVCTAAAHYPRDLATLDHGGAGYGGLSAGVHAVPTALGYCMSASEGDHGDQEQAARDS